MIFLSFFKYIVIDLNDVPLNINAMQKAERNMVGLDCLHEFIIIAVAKCIRKEDNPFCRVKTDILSTVLDTDALTNFQFGNSCRSFLTQFSLPPTIVIRFAAIAFFISEIGIFTVGEASSVLL